MIAHALLTIRHRAIWNKLMKILLTGAAGFICFHLIKELLKRGDDIVAIDNINAYYSSQLKYDRLQYIDDFVRRSQPIGQYQFIRMDISDRESVAQLFQNNSFDVVVNLAAQAGVRYSIENPSAYIDSNLVGFSNILEGCRQSDVKHLVYASSSSVYGQNVKQPFSTSDCVDFPISLYAATKKSNELLAHSYSHLFDLPTTGLRFFTVYGPWGRPDMAYFKFTKAILEGRPIDVYNYGEMKRDFTYIDDIIKGVILVLGQIPLPQETNITSSKAPYKIFNIGNNSPITLRRFITAIEVSCGKKAIENHLPMQAGDVPITYADIDDFVEAVEFSPQTKIENGLEMFVSWYREYYQSSLK